MKFYPGDIQTALSQLAILRYFPADDAARGAVAKLLAKMCPSLEALRWLTDEMVNTVGEWQGPRELRGVLCRKYTPADGVRVECAEVDGLTAETRYLEKQTQEYEAKLAQWKAQAALNPGEYQPFQIPAPRRIQ